MGDKAAKRGAAKPAVERVQADGVWCLVVRDEDGVRAFLDHCSHKHIPLGPGAALKKGRLRCPHHDVCFDRHSGAVADAGGKKVPEGLVPVPVTAGGDGRPVLTIRPEHRAYIEARQRPKKSRKKHKKTEDEN